MYKILFLFLPILLFAVSPFESLGPNSFDLSIYETRKSVIHEREHKNKKKCRIVCDKRLYNEKRISDAIEFYKNSKDYFNMSR